MWADSLPSEPLGKHAIDTLCSVKIFNQIYLVKASKLSFSVPGSHPGHCMTFSYHISLGSSGLWQFLRYSLLLMTLTVLRRTAGQVFGGLSFSCDQSAVLLIIRLGSYILGRNKGAIPLHSHCIEGTHYQSDLPLLMLPVVTWLRWYLPGISRFPLSPLLPHCPLERGHYAALGPSIEELEAPLLQGRVSP